MQADLVTVGRDHSDCTQSLRTQNVDMYVYAFN